jgi:hypothetical protein
VHARPQIREILIINKLKRWALISKYPSVDPTCPPSRARRNFHRLCARYPEIAAKIGMTAVSVYVL